ncbi:hypothetical protein MRX96_018137 [Rhipicephalus microplus]
MAVIKPPKPFDFQNAAESPAWMDEVDDRFASGLHKRKDEVQALKYGSKTEAPRARSFVLIKHRDPTGSKLKEKPHAETGVISSFSHMEEKQAPAACLAGGWSPERTFPTKFTVPGHWVDVLFRPCSAGLCQGSSSVALRQGDWPSP